MKYGKIRIEDGHLIFTRHMMINSLPCSDILWAYMRREGEEEISERQVLSTYLVVITKRKKKYKFDMSEREVQDCIALLKALNPEMAVGFPRGSRIALQSLANTRDLGAIMTEDGRHIIPRKLLRSGDLYHTSLGDKEILADEYHLKTVIDLRTVAEREQKPDTIIAGVEYYHIPVLDEEALGIARDKNMTESFFELPADPEEFMIRQYSDFIRDPYCVKQFAKFIDVILHHKDGAVLWHCSAGKDRAGVGTALLLYILGVPRETIREDFMRTNRYLEPELHYMERLLEAQGKDSLETVQKLHAFFIVKEAYIDAVFDTIEEEYGTMERFFRKDLYLTQKSVDDLREKYLL